MSRSSMHVAQHDPESCVISIAGRAVGPGERPYIVAEMSGNHNGDISRAIKILNAAAKAGEMR